MSDSIFNPATSGIFANDIPVNVNAQLVHTAAGLAAVKAGIRNSRWLCLGDSTTFGAFSSGTGDSGNLKALCYPQQLSDELNAMGINATADSTLGWGGDGLENNAANDGKIVMGNAWIEGNTQGVTESFGGRLFQAQNSTGGALTFTPTKNVDTFNYFYVTTSGVNPISYSIDSGTATSQATAGSDGLGSLQLTTTLGAHTGKAILSTGGSIAFHLGFEAYNSASKCVSIMNAGWPGAQTSFIAESSKNWMPVNQMSFFSPDLVILMTGINDWANGIALSTVQTNLLALVNAIQAAGADCMLMTPVPSAITSTPYNTQLQYVNLIRNIAAQKNCALVDNFAIWQSYEISNPLGLYNQVLHPSGAGYAKIPRSILSKIFSNL